MGKPNGIALSFNQGLPILRVTGSDHVTDKVWDAVSEALEAGWTVEQFRRECAKAWDEAKKDEMDSDATAWRL